MPNIFLFSEEITGGRIQKQFFSHMYIPFVPNIL